MTGRRTVAAGRRAAAGAFALALIVVAVGAPVAPARAQPEAEMVEVNALQCWRWISAHAVHVGERFDMLLTCAVVETDDARAVPDDAWLAPETLAVSPFEVLEGERYADLVRGSRRFFQYRYALRIIGEEYFGLDVDLPSLEVRYRIERSLDGGPFVEGRELVHVLPAEPIRVLSLVPATAAGIRELAGDTFGDAEARLFRANAASIVAAALAAAALLVLLAALLRVRGFRRGAVAAGKVRIADWQVARAVLTELRGVRAASEAEGWTDELVARALAAFRIAGALAIGRPVAQRPADTPGDTGLPVSRWPMRRGGVFVSSAVTLSQVTRAVDRMRRDRPGDTAAAETMRDAMALFGAVRYGPGGQSGDEGRDNSDLHATLESMLELLRRLSFSALPPVRAVVRWREAWASRWPRRRATAAATE